VKAVSVAERPGAIETGAPEALPLLPKAEAPGSSGLFGDASARVPSPDGRRFLVRRHVAEDLPEPLRLVRSWRSLLER
jgi:hypothetical protein